MTILKIHKLQLAEVKPEKVQWLWHNRIPKGKVTIIAGDPDVGKSFLTMDIAARVSTGRKWPDGTENKKGRVLIMSAEDDPADTIVPRLDQLCADRKNIDVLQRVERLDKDNKIRPRTPAIDRDLETLYKNLKEGGNQPSVLIIDPVNAYIEDTNTYNDAEMRNRVFAPLAEFARKLNIAVICIMHLSKKNTSNSKHRVSGSIAYVAAARAVYLVGNEPHSNSRKLMLPIKFNLGPKPDGRAFKILQNDDGAPYIEWDETPVSFTADQLLDPETISKLQEAKNFLKELLKNGPHPAKDIYKEADQNGITKRTLQRAKRCTGVKSNKHTDNWTWELNDNN